MLVFVTAGLGACGGGGGGSDDDGGSGGGSSGGDGDTGGGSTVDPSQVPGLDANGDIVDPGANATVSYALPDDTEVVRVNVMINAPTGSVWSGRRSGDDRRRRGLHGLHARRSEWRG